MLVHLIAYLFIYSLLDWPQSSSIHTRYLGFHWSSSRGSAGLYSGGVSSAGEETQDGRPGAKRPGHHHGYWTEGATQDEYTPEMMTHYHTAALMITDSFMIRLTPSVLQLCASLLENISIFPVYNLVPVCVCVCSTCLSPCCPETVSTTSSGGSALTCRFVDHL